MALLPLTKGYQVSHVCVTQTSLAPTHPPFHPLLLIRADQVADPVSVNHATFPPGEGDVDDRSLLTITDC